MLLGRFCVLGAGGKLEEMPIWLGVCQLCPTPREEWELGWLS